MDRRGVHGASRGNPGGVTARDAAVRRLGRHRLTWQDPVEKGRTLNPLRGEYGHRNKAFEIMLALREPASVDLFKRAEDIGVTAVMCSPWAMADDAIERFAEEILAKMS